MSFRTGGLGPNRSATTSFATLLEVVMSVSRSVLSHGGKGFSNRLDELPKADAILLARHQAPEHRLLKERGKPRVDGKAQHDGHACLGHGDEIVHVLVLLQESEYLVPPECYGRDYVQGEVAALLGKIRGTELCLRGQILALYQADEAGYLFIELWLQALDVLPGVLSR